MLISHSSFLPFCSSCSSGFRGFASGSCGSFAALSALPNVCRPEKCAVHGSGFTTFLRPQSNTICLWQLLCNVVVYVRGRAEPTVLRDGINRQLRLHSAERDVGFIRSGSEVNRVALQEEGIQIHTETHILMSQHYGNGTNFMSAL